MTPTCFTCIYSFGAIEHLKEASTLICWPSGNQAREQLAYKLCDEYRNSLPNGRVVYDGKSRAAGT